MRPTDELSKSFKELHVSTSSQLDESISSEICRAVDETESRNSGTFGAIFKVRLTKLAAAAIIVAAILGLHQFGSSIRGTGIAWADVAERLGKVRSYKALADRALGEVGEEPFYQCEILRHFSPDHGAVEESYVDGELVMLAYTLFSETSALIVFPQSKQYFRFDLNEELRSLVEFVNPANTEGMMALFGSERCVKLGSREIDGVRTEGFEVKDVQVFSRVPRFLLEVKGVDIRLWVSEETLLPVRVEGEGLIGKGLLTGFKELRYSEVMYDIEYDVEIDDGIFEPNIPDDYMLIDPAGAAQKAELVMICILPFSGAMAVYRRFKKGRGGESVTS